MKKKKQDLITRQANLKQRTHLSYKSIKQQKQQANYQRKIKEKKRIQATIRKQLNESKIKIPKYAKLKPKKYKRIHAQLKAYEKSIKLLRQIFKKQKSR